jgi:hypothetical protein
VEGQARQQGIAVAHLQLVHCPLLAVHQHLSVPLGFDDLDVVELPVAEGLPAPILILHDPSATLLPLDELI